MMLHDLVQKAYRTLFCLFLMGTLGSCASSSKRTRGHDYGNYNGLGAESISAETLAEFAPKALPPELSASVRNILEVSSPGLGMMNSRENALYFSWGVTGASQIWKVSEPLGFPTQVTSGTDSTSLVDITEDGKFLILSRDHSGEENPGLYLQSTLGGPLIEIQHKKNVRTTFVYSTLDNETIFYMANDRQPDSYALYAYSRESGKKELIFSEPGLWYVADVLNGNKFLLGRSTGSLTAEFYVFSLNDRKLVPVLGQGAKEQYSAVFGKDSSELFVVTSKFGDYRRLYRYRQGKFDAVTPDVKKDVESISISENHRLMVIQWNDGGYTKLQAIDPASLQTIELPGLPKADQTYAGSLSRFSRFISIGIETGLAPRTSYIFDFKTHKLTQWVKPSAPEIDMKKFVPSKLESYPASDGTAIPMLVTRPSHCFSEVCPVVVHFHGGPEGQSRPGFNRLAQLFAAQGYIFVEPNVRGSEGYGKTWLAADDGPKRLDVIGDIEDCSKFIRKSWAKNGISPKVGVMGWSYGGYSTLMAMSRFAGSYDAGVALVGMSNLKSFLLNTAPYRRVLRISEYGDPEKDQAALAKLSPITYLDQVRDPLMIIQGASDPRVPVGEALQMRSALEKRGIEAPLIIFADEGHGSAKRENRVIEIGSTIRFFNEHLKHSN